MRWDFFSCVMLMKLKCSVVFCFWRVDFDMRCSVWVRKKKLVKLFTSMMAHFFAYEHSKSYGMTFFLFQRWCVYVLVYNTQLYHISMFNSWIHQSMLYHMQHVYEKRTERMRTIDRKCHDGCNTWYIFLRFSVQLVLTFQNTVEAKNGNETYTEYIGIRAESPNTNTNAMSVSIGLDMSNAGLNQFALL